MKKILVLTFILLMLLSFSTVNAQNSLGNIKVVVDGMRTIFTDAYPFIDENNRTLVPLRAVAEAMGLTVSWDPNEGAVFTKEYTWDNSPMHEDLDGDYKYDTYLGSRKVTFKIGENVASYEESWYDKGDTPKENFPVSGGLGEINMDTAAIIKDSRTYAPIRYLAEAFGFNVGWDDGVYIDYMYSLDNLGIQIEEIACWEDYQGWFLIANESSNITSIDVLSISINKEPSEYSMLTDDEKKEIEEASGLNFGSYRNGFIVHKNLEINNYYNYKVKILVTMNGGYTKYGFIDIYMLFNGQGGYI